MNSLTCVHGLIRACFFALWLYSGYTCLNFVSLPDVILHPTRVILYWYCTVLLIIEKTYIYYYIQSLYASEIKWDLYRISTRLVCARWSRSCKSSISINRSFFYYYSLAIYQKLQDVRSRSSTKRIIMVSTENFQSRKNTDNLFQREKWKIRDDQSVEVKGNSGLRQIYPYVHSYAVVKCYNHCVHSDEMIVIRGA